jgi:crotonobetainyl-CoA:carnitine CoA-transferase CaiB-like acyl-CoA transferase
MKNGKASALAGMRVVEASSYIAGPLGAKILGDLGADVIKIENKFTKGDAARFAGSPFKDGVASFMQTLNAGKKCVTFNLKDPRGLELLYGLIKDTDIFIDNRPAGSSEAQGLGYDRLCEINPQIIVIRVTGYGLTSSKYRDWIAFDPLFEGLSGFMTVTGEPGTPPVKAGVAIGDMSAGTWVALAAVTAYHYREKTGKGQLVDFAMLDGMLALMENNLATYSFSGKAPGKIGNRHPNVGPFNTFKCKDDKYVFIVCGNNKQAFKLFEVIGHPELKDDPHCQSQNDIVAYHGVIEPLIQEFTDQHTADEVVSALVSNSIAAGPIFDMEDVYNDQYFWDRKMIVKVHDDTIGEIAIPGSPLSNMSETPAVVDKPADTLGGSNAAVLKEYLGKTDAEIEQYLKDDVI